MNQLNEEVAAIKHSIDWLMSEKERLSEVYYEQVVDIDKKIISYQKELMLRLEELNE